MPAAAAAMAAAVSSGAAATGTTRWCPTAEQLMVLEEMYRGGLRTPNASQIQQITAHLAHYGRIEGKNVFYWFQNHKARDRQKLRRRLCMTHHLLSCAAAAAAAQQQYHHYATAAAGHGHGQFFAAGAGAGGGGVPNHTMAVQQQQQYYSAASAMACPAGGFDQHHHQLLATSPMAPAGYGTCYPAAGFASSMPQPGSRCTGGVSPAPAPASNPFPQYQQGGGGSPEYSLGRLGSLGVVVDQEEADTCRSTGYDYHNQQQMQLAARMEAAEATPAVGFCRPPLKTLDLFPGASVKDEQLA